MIIQIRVVVKSSRALVQEINGVYKVYCTKPADRGQANAQVVELLSEYLKVKKYRVKIIHGAASRTKLVEIIGE